MRSWIWEVPARVAGMGFAYGLSGFERLSNMAFSDPPLFVVFVFGFDRGLEIGMIPEGTKHAIPLWIAMVGAFFDRRFFRKRPPIEDYPLVFCFFSDFEGGLKIGVIHKGTKHPISR